MRALWNLFIDLLYAAWLGVEHLAGITAPRAIQYLRILAILAVVAIVVPAIPALIGLVSGWGWLVAVAGILWGSLALLLVVLAAPLGVLINILLGAIGLQARNQTAGRRYILFTGSILMFGMFFALMVSVLPWRNNPGVVPFMLLAAAILAVSGAVFGTAGLLGRNIIVFVTSFILATLTISLFFPRSFAELSSARQRIDQSLADRLSNRLVSGANYPVCAETERAIIITLKNPEAQIPVFPECFSGWISIQSDEKVSFRLYKQPEGGFLEVCFMDGSRRIIHENERVWFGHIPRLEFRLRGTQGIVRISIEPVALNLN
ncbi:MAG: hypothetical protein ACPL3E_01395 [Minisyncoccia bacterium]